MVIMKTAINAKFSIEDMPKSHILHRVEKEADFALFKLYAEWFKEQLKEFDVSHWNEPSFSMHPVIYIPRICSLKALLKHIKPKTEREKTLIELGFKLHECIKEFEKTIDYENTYKP